MNFKIIDSALKNAGCTRLDDEKEKKMSGKGTTACFIYKAEDENFRYAILIQATPKKDLIYTFLEGGEKN